MSNKEGNIVSRWFVHFFHVVSNVRPLVWISGYILLIPVFALVYWLLPVDEFRMAEGASADFGSWLYYSIVTITTLGFGDYTPAGREAQFITSLEVMCGLVLLGFFLNAVGAMKSEVDLSTERERQRALHCSREHDKLVKSIPLVVRRINAFMAYCYAVTTPEATRKDVHEYNPKFTLADMVDMYKPSGFPDDRTGLSATAAFMLQAERLSLCIDSLQTRIDLTLWPDLLEDCFTYVANFQLLDASAKNVTNPVDSQLIASATTVPDHNNAGALLPVVELYQFIKENGDLALRIEVLLTKISTESPCLPQP